QLATATTPVYQLDLHNTAGWLGVEPPLPPDSGGSAGAFSTSEGVSFEAPLTSPFVSHRRLRMTAIAPVYVANLTTIGSLGSLFTLLMPPLTAIPPAGLVTVGGAVSGGIVSLSGVSAASGADAQSSP